MATFVSTIKLTDEGSRSIGDTTKRAAAFKAAAKTIGVKVISQFWTLGRFDGLLIFEAPDDETATAAMLQLGSLDFVQTSTMRVFNAAEMEKILTLKAKRK